MYRLWVEKSVCANINKKRTQEKQFRWIASAVELFSFVEKETGDKEKKEREGRN